MMLMVPRPRGTSPTSARMSVVLPAPSGPVTHRPPPGSTAQLMSVMAGSDVP